MLGLVALDGVARLARLVVVIGASLGVEGWV